MFARVSGQSVGRDLVLVRQPKIRVSIAMALARGLARVVSRAVVSVARHPVVTLAVLTLGWLWAGLGPSATAAVVAVVALALTGWRIGHRSSFCRFVMAPARTGWRRWWVYARHWQPAMTLSGLSAMYRGTEHLPVLRTVRCQAFVDRVTVRMLTGQAVADFEKAAEALAHVFGARACRVRHHKPATVILELARGDPLAELVPAQPPQQVCDLAAVPVGRSEDGHTWALRLLGSHVLVAGATGSGKGSVFWSLLRGLAPGVRDGLVQCWALDPKGGMELGPGAPLFSRFAFADLASMADLLEDAVALMDERAIKLMGQTRLHEPSTAQPLVVVLVDELASLTAYVTDRDLRRRIGQALSLLLSKGRAVGVLVVAAVQDPARTCSPSVTCSRSALAFGWWRRRPWTWFSATGHANAARSATRSHPQPRASGSCSSTGTANPSAYGPRGSTTRTSAPSPHSTPRPRACTPSRGCGRMNAWVQLLLDPDAPIPHHDLVPALTRRVSRGWRHRAACRGHDPELWFPLSARTDEAATAKAICARCPVRSSCLALALAGDEVGIWAGTTDPDRATALDRLRAGAAIDTVLDDLLDATADASGGEAA